MKTTDARSLPAPAQEALRRRAVEAVRNGMPRIEAARRYGLSRSVWPVGRYLKRWGLTPQKPRRRAFEQDPAAVRRWLSEEYPAIRRGAKQAGGESHWGGGVGRGPG